MKARYALLAAGLAISIPACEQKSDPVSAAPEPTPVVVEEEVETLVLDATQVPAAPQAGDVSLPDPVAIVNGEPIGREEFLESLNEVFGAMGLSPSMLPPAQQAMLYRQFVDDLIVDRLVDLASRDTPVSDEEVEEMMEDFRRQFPSPQAFESELAEAGQTMDMLKERLVRIIRQRKWMESQVASVPPAEEAEVVSFYEENPQEFEQPEMVRASHILFLVEPDASEEEVEAARAKAVAASANAKQEGADFSALAAELSEEPGAAERGGDLDYFTRERMVPEFADASFSMEVDQISEPVRTQFGWHVIKVTDKKEARTVPLAEVREQVAEYLSEAKKQEAVEIVISELQKNANVEIKLPEPPSQEGPVGTSPGQAGE